MPPHLTTLIPKLANQRVLVVGDVILDEYLIGRAARMSREAPIPVLEFEERRLIPGGAANPAANIAGLGSTALQVGVLGADAAATTLHDVLQTTGIDLHGLVTDTTRPTTVKTRIMAQMGLRFPQQVARMDTLSREPISTTIGDRLIEYIDAVLSQVQAVLVSDYHAGLMTQALVDGIREKAAAARLISTADAQGALEKYTGFTLVKCNADDARAYLQQDLNTDADFEDAAQRIRERLKLAGAMVITRGVDGATLATADGLTTHCPAPVVTDVYDTVGAGDTAIAVMTLALVAGASYIDAVTLANYASGLVVRRVGNYTPTRDELLEAVTAENS